MPWIHIDTLGYNSQILSIINLCMFPSGFNQLKIILDLIINSPYSNVHMINFAKVYKAENSNISLTFKEP